MRRLVVVIIVSLLCAGIVPQADPAISIDVRNASILDVVALLARESGANIVADESVRSTRVTLRLTNVHFRQALDILAASHGLEVVARGGVLILGSPEALHREGVDASSASEVVLYLRRARASDVGKALTSLLPSGSVIVPDVRTNDVVILADPASIRRAQSLATALDGEATTPASRETVSYALRFTRAEDVLKALKALLGDGTFAANDDDNAVVVVGDEAAQTSAKRIIDSIDVAGKEVLFEVRVADLTPVNDSSDVGMEFGGSDLQGNVTSGSTTYAFTGGSIAVNVRLSALVTNGRAQILATPRLVTLNGKEADLLIGETYPVVYNTSVLGGSNVQFVDIGVKLRLTPIIGPDGSVTAEMHPEYSELQGFTSSGYPIIANRKIDSTLRVRSGQTIVLGGLLRDVSSETIQRLPWLSDIPVLGKLFQDRQASRERDEIVFLITPHVIDADAPPTQ
jgi:type IV pilus assembly protein PilQ